MSRVAGGSKGGTQPTIHIIKRLGRKLLVTLWYTKLLSRLAGSTVQLMFIKAFSCLAGFCRWGRGRNPGWHRLCRSHAAWILSGG
jgi:hypothetical protein